MWKLIFILIGRDWAYRALFGFDHTNYFYIMLKNGKTYFKNLVVLTLQRF